jgi:hypothetical protein
MAFRKVIETISDRTKFALVSTSYVIRKPKYLIVCLLTFLIFLFFLTFFRDGNSNWQLLWSGLPLGRKLEVLGRIFPAILENFTSMYGVTIVFLSIFQAIVVMQLVYAWRHRDRASALNGASTGGIAAVFGFIALGCPTCGIGLLTPLLSAIAGSAAVTLAESLGYIFTIIAFILLFYTIISLGYTNYINIINENHKEEHAKSH